MTKTPTFRDVEQISAFLDGKLSKVETRRLNARLDADPGLAAVYNDLLQAKTLLRKTPQRRAPRNFTLTPKMAGIKPPVPRAVPFMRLASVLTAFLLFMTFAINFASSPSFGAPMAYGVGGGMGGGGGAPEEAMAEPSVQLEAVAVTEAPAPAPKEAYLPTEAPSADATTPELRLLTPTPEAAPTAMAAAPVPAEPTQAPETTGLAAQPKTAAGGTENLPPEQLPARARLVSGGWQAGLAVLAVLFAGGAFLSIRLSDARWRRKR